MRSKPSQHLLSIIDLTERTRRPGFERGWPSYSIVVRRRKNVNVREVKICVRKLAVNSSVCAVGECAALPLAPTEVRCEFLKSSFFVVAVFLWSNRVLIRINMHREATRNPHMVPLGWGKERKKIFFLSLILYDFFFLLEHLAEL